MGIGDSIRKAADNAMKDLGDNAPPADDGHVPAPDTREGDVQVHSSISEGSNAMHGDEEDHRPADEVAGDSLAGDPARTIGADQGASDSDVSADETAPGA
jgi:hypothetical protein